MFTLFIFENFQHDFYPNGAFEMLKSLTIPKKVEQLIKQNETGFVLLNSNNSPQDKAFAANYLFKRPGQIQIVDLPEILLPIHAVGESYGALSPYRNEVALELSLTKEFEANATYYTKKTDLAPLENLLAKHEEVQVLYAGLGLETELSHTLTQLKKIIPNLLIVKDLCSIAKPTSYPNSTPFEQTSLSKMAEAILSTDIMKA